MFTTLYLLCTTSTIIAYVNNWHLRAFHGLNQLIVALIVCLLNKVHVARLRGCCCNYGNRTWREVFSFMHVLQMSPCKSAGTHSHQSNLPMH